MILFSCSDFYELIIMMLGQEGDELGEADICTIQYSAMTSPHVCLQQKELVREFMKKVIKFY